MITPASLLGRADNDYSEEAYRFSNSEMTRGLVGFVDTGATDNVAESQAGAQEREAILLRFLRHENDVPAVAIVINVALRPPMFPDVLRSLAKQRFVRYRPDRAELLIIQDGSEGIFDRPVDSDLLDALTEFPPQTNLKCFRLLREERDKSQGRSTARNVGLVKASPTSNVVLFLDDAIVLHPDFIAEQMLRHALVGPKIALIGFKENLRIETLRADREAILSGSRRPDFRKDWKWSHILGPKEIIDGKQAFAYAGQTYTAGSVIEYMNITDNLRLLRGDQPIGYRSLPTFFHTGLTSAPLAEVLRAGGFEKNFDVDVWGLEDSFLGLSLAIEGVKLVPCPSSVAFKIELPGEHHDRQREVEFQRETFRQFAKRPWKSYREQELREQIEALTAKDLLEPVSIARQGARGASKARSRFRATPAFALDAHFRGRWSERQLLSQWACGHGDYGTIPVLTLSAMGGMGKSNLAWLWTTHDMAGDDIPSSLRESPGISERSRPRPEWPHPLCILWFSFYRQEGGRDFRAFLEEAIVHLSAGTRRPEDFQVDGRVDHERMRRELLEICTTQPCLIVWDGAERLLNEYSTADPALQEERSLQQIRSEDDALRCRELEVSQFLWAMTAQSASKLLICSRLPFLDLDNKAGARVLELKGIDAEAAVEMLRGRGIGGSDSLLQQAALDYECHPLSLSNLAASLLSDFEFTAHITGRKPIDPAAPQDRRRKHVFSLAFQRRAPHRRHLLSRLATVRGMIGREVVRTLATDITGLQLEELGRDLSELVRHGLLRRTVEGDAYNFHPVIRRYIYERPEYSSERRAIHGRLKEHYRTLTVGVDLGALSTLDELSPFIEQYFHTARAGQYPDALLLFKSHPTPTLNDLLYYELCAYVLFIDLLKELCPDGEQPAAALPRTVHGTILNDLSHAYARLGQAEKARNLLERAIVCHREILGDNPPGRAQLKRIARVSPLDALALKRSSQEVGLGFEGLAARQMELGFLKEAHASLKEAQRYYGYSGYGLGQAIVQGLEGELFAYLGQFQRGRRSLRISIEFAKQNYGNDKEPDLHMVRGLCLGYTELAHLELLASQPSKAKEHADSAVRLLAVLTTQRQARELTVRVKFVSGYARVQAESGLGAAELLGEALAECRRLRLVELEPRLLLAHAELLIAQARPAERGANLGSSLSDAHRTATEALNIAHRCKYRLQEAESHNVLGVLELLRGDLDDARRHAQQAIERAQCGQLATSEYRYKLAIEVAGKTLRDASAQRQE
jgi:glycosyltransferase involved in cell wall biosynthesis